MAITQPGGLGATIFYYKDSDATNHASSPGPHTFAEISAAFPADFIDNGTTPKSYRSKVDIQCGDVGTGTDTTTLTDSNVSVFFDTGKTWLWRSTQTTSWNTNLGTKVGSGNSATGKNGCVIYTAGKAAVGTTIRGNFAIYGTTWINNLAALNFGTTNVSGLTMELVNCILGHTGTASLSNIQVGGTSIPVTNCYNVDFWSNVTAANNGAVANFNMTNAERMTIGGSGPYLLRSPTNVAACKDVVFFGTPTVADILPSGAPTSWELVRPRWSGNAPRMGPNSIAAGIVKERWVWDVKVVDISGHGISAISVRLTDVLGNLQVDAVTNSTGQVAFGSGLLQNAVIVRDHYGDGSLNYLTRDRSPFLVQINTVNTNPAYKTLSYYHDWPGLSTGNFEDVSDIVPLEPQPPIRVSTLVKAAGTDQIICPTPRQAA